MEKSKQTSPAKRAKPESYQTKYNREMLNSTLNKKKGRTFLYAAVGFCILLGIGYEAVMNYALEMKGEPKNSREINMPASPLRIVKEEERQLLDAERLAPKRLMSPQEQLKLIEELSRVKSLQAERIRELKEDLADAEEWMRQLKSEIVMKGGRREQSFKEEIAALKGELEESFREIERLREEALAGNALLEGKREEWERATNIFAEAHERLQKEVIEKGDLLDEERRKRESLFDELARELALSSGEAVGREELVSLFSETKKRIVQLEMAVENANSAALEEMLRVEELKRELAEAAANYREAKMTIRQLTTEFEARELLGSKIGEQGGKRLPEPSDGELLIAMNSEIPAPKGINSQEKNKFLFLEEQLKRSQIKIKELEREVEELLSNSEYEPIGPTSDRGGKELEALKGQISSLERALSLSEGKLKEAKEALKSRDSYSQSIVEMEEYYEGKIKELQSANRLYEEQLEEAEEGLKRAYDKIAKYSEQLALLQSATREGARGSAQKIQELQRERESRLELEKEVAELRELLSEQKAGGSKGEAAANERAAAFRLEQELMELKNEYREEKMRGADLQARLEALGKLATTLQNELAAQKTASSGGLETASTPSKLRAKITYLTTRLAQEKSRAAGSEEKLQQALLSIEELKNEKSRLEEQLRKK